MTTTPLPTRNARALETVARNGRLVRLGITVVLVGALGAFAVAPTQLPDSYNWTEHGISESAAQGIDGAWLARTGFILFGLAVIWITSLRQQVWGGLGTMLHLGFGVCMFGVAAFSAKPWSDNAPYVESEDALHSVYASIMGFCFIAGVVAVMIARRLPSISAALPDLLALLVTISIPMMMSSSIWGALQRLMFATAAAWYGREARSITEPTTTRAASTPTATSRAGHVQKR